MLEQSDYELFASLYQGREGVLRQRKGGLLLGEALTLERIEGQIAGGESYGIYLRRLDGKVHLGMLDLDVPDCHIPPEIFSRELDKIKPALSSYIEAAEQMGLSKEHCLVEFCGVGYHIWFFLEEPLPAELVANFLERIGSKAGLNNVPLKPGKTVWTEGSYGESVWLPLRNNTNSGLNSIFVKDLVDFDPANYDSTIDFSHLNKVKRVQTDLIIKNLE